MWRLGLALVLATAILGVASSEAMASVTPGWECIPTTAGQAVVSGGTGAAPSCGAGSTAVLAPTFISSGVGGKPTVQFSAVNLQVVSGAGATSATVNGKGNLIVGYAEDTTGHARTGSNDLVVGSENGWTSYGEMVGGFANRAAGKYATATGTQNVASGAYSLAAGDANQATGSGASATGGKLNLAQGTQSTVTGGQDNLASNALATVAGGCRNLSGSGSPLSGTCPTTTGAQAILGGFENTASGLESTVSGGEVNTASGGAASIAGGQLNIAHGGGGAVAGGNGNSASGSFASILGGLENSATTFEASVAGGSSNSANANSSSILGGDGNTTASNCQAIPAAPGTC